MKLFLPIFCVVSLFVVQTLQCGLPKAKVPIDWEKVPKKWYLAFSTDDAIREVAQCQVLHDFEGDENYYSFGVHAYHGGVVRKNLVVEKSLQSDGNYNILITPIDSEAVHPLEKRKANAETEINKVNSEETLTVTDNKSYLCHVSCGDNDDWIVWCYADTPRPTPQTMLGAIEGLKAHGIKDVWRPSLCWEID